MRQLVTIEILATVFLGAVPCGLIASSSGFDALMGYVSSLSVLPEVLFYLFVLYVVNLSLILFESKGWLKAHEGTISNRLILVFEQIGTSLIGVFRVIAGVLLVIGPAAMYIEADFKAYVYGVLGVCFALAIIGIGSWLQYVARELKNNQRGQSL